MVEPVAEQVHAYIVGAFLPPEAVGDFQDDTDLLQVLDSLQLLRLVVHLESSFGIKISDAELNAENLGSVERIAAFIARKRSVGCRNDDTRLGD